jgi:hypothetical protein
MMPRHFIMLAVILVVGYVLGRKFPQLGMGYV